jgi:hypothetical protein
VEDRENARANDGENGHRFGGAIDRGSPLLAQKAQNRRNERSGVADTDPENEVDDRPSPVRRIGESPDSGPRNNEVDKSAHGERGDKASDRETDPPPARRRSFDDSAHLVGDPGEAPVVFDQGGARQDARFNLTEERCSDLMLFGSGSH